MEKNLLINKMIKNNGDKNFAYVMLLIIDEVYVPASLVLAESLRKTACLADLVVMIDNNISKETRELLKKFYDKIIEIEKIKVDNVDKIQKYLVTKIEALKLTEYEKIAIIDIDSIILDQPNNIFDEKSPGIIYSKSSKNFNTGLVLLEPNIKDYENIKLMSIPKDTSKTFLYVLEKYYKKINKLEENYLKSNDYSNALGIQFNVNKPFIMKSSISIETRVKWPHFKLWFLYFKNILNDYPDIEKNKCLDESIELSKYYLASLSRFMVHEKEINKPKLKRRVEDLYGINTNKDLDYYHLDISKEYDSDDLTYLINDYSVKSFVEYVNTKTNLLKDSRYTSIIDIKTLLKSIDDNLIIDWILSEYIKIFNNIFVVLLINDNDEDQAKIPKEMKENLIFKKEFVLMGIVLKSIMFNIFQNNVYSERIIELSVYNDYTQYRIQILLYQTVYPLDNLSSSSNKIFLINDTNSRVRLSSIFFNSNTLNRFVNKKINLISKNKINKKGLISLLKFQTVKKWLYNNYTGNQLDNVIIIKAKPFTILDTNDYGKNNDFNIKRLKSKNIKLINIIFKSDLERKNKFKEIIKNINNPTKYWVYEGIKMYIE